MQMYEPKGANFNFFAQTEASQILLIVSLCIMVLFLIQGLVELYSNRLV
jgi:hypothetical protein